MNLKNMIIICLAVIMGLTVIGCDQDADVGGDNPLENIENVTIGFNIKMKLPPFNKIQAAYPEVTEDWITDATMDIIDAVWIVYHDGTSDTETTRLAPAVKRIDKDNQDGTGVIYAGITSAELASEKGLTMDIRPVKYQQAYDSSVKESEKKVYYLGNLKNPLVIDGKISHGYYNMFDVTVDGIWANLDLNASVPSSN